MKLISVLPKSFSEIALKNLVPPGEISLNVYFPKVRILCVLVKLSKTNYNAEVLKYKTLLKSTIYYHHCYQTNS